MVDARELEIPKDSVRHASELARRNSFGVVEVAATLYKKPGKVSAPAHAIGGFVGGGGGGGGGTVATVAAAPPPPPPQATQDRARPSKTRILIVPHMVPP